MLKKKNIAMVMAAATVATSVAPVFAASLDGETVSAKDSAKLAQLKEEIKGYLDLKYTKDESLLKDENLAGKPVYTIKLHLNGDVQVGDLAITSMKDLDRELVKFSSKDDFIKITVEENAAGHKTVNGNVIDCTTSQYKKADITDLIKGVTVKDLNVAAGKSAAGDKAIDTDPVQGVDVGSDFVSIDLLNNSTPLVLKVGEDKTVTFKSEGVLDDLKVIYKKDAFGNNLDSYGKITKDEKDFVVLGFDKFKAPIDASDKEAVKNFKISNKEEVKGVDAKTIYNMDLEKYTQEGNEIAKFIRDYNFATPTGDKIAKVAEESNDLTLVLEVPKTKEGITNKFDKLVIKGTKNEIAKVEAALTGAIASDLSVGNKITTLAGEDREATAIEVSKKNFPSSGNADSVVLVSGTSIADGLTATPFAKSENAPVLLTGSDKISDKVMNEIKRVMKSGGNVYLVGGTNSLKTSIEDQLDSQFIKYERIAGADRADTSLKVAKKMDAASSELFVTGGYAEADSMSVAAVAAQKTAPILLAGESGLTREQSKFVSDKATSAIFNKTYVVGGTSKVSTDVEKSLASLVKGDVTRLAGEDRQGTNAKVISNFYPTVTNLHVAKAGDKGLVDALATGVLAAKDAVSPVLLVGETLSSDQKAVLTKNSYDSAVGKKVQIGYGIADKVWEAINKIK